MNIKKITVQQNKSISESTIDAASFGMEYNKFSIGNKGIFKLISYGVHGTWK